MILDALMEKNINNVKKINALPEDLTKLIFKKAKENDPNFSFVAEELPEIHPGISAKILLDREEIGIIGRIHPSIKKDDIYMAEISLSKIMDKKIKPIKCSIFSFKSRKN